MYEKSITLVSIFSNFAVDLDEIEYFATTYWFVEALILNCCGKQYSNQRRELC